MATAPAHELGNRINKFRLEAEKLCGEPDDSWEFIALRADSQEFLIGAGLAFSIERVARHQASVRESRTGRWIIAVIEGCNEWEEDAPYVSHQFTVYDGDFQHYDVACDMLVHMAAQRNAVAAGIFQV